MASQSTADEARIQQQIDSLAQAIGDMDIGGVKHMYASDIVSFDVQPPLERVGVEGKAQNWVDAFAVFQHPASYEVRSLTITVGDDVAFAHGFARLSGTLKNGETTNGFWVRVTYCFRKIDDQWLIAHDHVSVPLDFASGRALLNLEP